MGRKTGAAGAESRGTAGRPDAGEGGREEAEAVVVSESVETEAVGQPPPNGIPANGAEPTDELPAPEDFAPRIPAEVLSVMDELFRAKWTVVKRLRPGDLKNGGSA